MRAHGLQAPPAPRSFLHARAQQPNEVQFLHLYPVHAHERQAPPAPSPPLHARTQQPNEVQFLRLYPVLARPPQDPPVCEFCPLDLHMRRLEEIHFWSPYPAAERLVSRPVPSAPSASPNNRYQLPHQVLWPRLHFLRANLPQAAPAALLILDAHGEQPNEAPCLRLDLVRTRPPPA